ncbi:molybdopterin-dependent oxidoreductase [Rhodococcus hoagii]|uniref:Molybdopterin-dependent oxidoreductase n=1 Tax=Rhodococcus hoagii TaxID=43767 RepID=A0AAE3B948_RHOHA|nr:molybdopterin-dependent oxidoreductase [Prescottella equi]MBM4713262.1 molybdopterin-dependent oxidoreductase [Prescottella equi]NKS12354.1 molybdopterin-dependent oxidoreductase [Prescottella equi]NKS49757.1 molybdopterin-dependent oxidoreductase [Prescottella equi]NKS51771.1 molybdopterin-dependent oxidoreductase [Prescottella equi]
MGTSFGRGGATNYQQDLVNADCIIIQGSNMAECHPVGFQWVMEAKLRGAKVIHVDPRFTRTSAVADLHVPVRAGSDIAFLGGLINYVLANDAYFHDYVVAYTNAPMIVSDDFRDTEDLAGLFSGFDVEGRQYDTSSWQYRDGGSQSPAAGARDAESGETEASGSGGALTGSADEVPQRDDSLRDPRCVFQVLKRHFERYTPEMVEQACGVPRESFLEVARALTENSGRDRTSAFCYAVGWTQHTVGVQYIRTASILQLLLGNIGRPGGGIMALRGHASIQGSTDIPTLYNLLPGYIPMPHAHKHIDLDTFVGENAGAKGFWGNMRAYTVSMLKSWWGDAATAENDFCFDYLPRLTGTHDSTDTVERQINEGGGGYFLVGENPAVGTANARMQRAGLANLDWLVVRDLAMIESATFWKDGPEIETGEMRTEDIGTEVFFFPAANHAEKQGSFTNTQRLLQWHRKALDPPGDARSDLWFYFHLGRILKEKLADSTDERDRPLLDLVWDYPMEPGTDEPDAVAVLAEINGTGPDGQPLSMYTQLREDGSTRCGCWIYCGVYGDGVNQADRRRSRHEQGPVAPDWGWAWPANRRVLYNRASADPDGKPWSERKAFVWWDPDANDGAGRWTGHDVPDFEADKPPTYRAPEGARAEDAINGTEPFIMQNDGRAWLYAPVGLLDGPMPTHYEPPESPLPNPLYPQQSNPARMPHPGKFNRYNPAHGAAGSEVFPYMFTTYRLTEHHTAGGMSRTLPYLSELQPEFFCEVSPELAAERGLENGGWATIVTARTAIEARVLVTHRMQPLVVDGRRLHQIGLPYHWGRNGISVGDGANELLPQALDPNVSIPSTKATSCDIQPGRRPRGPALLEYVAEYRRRAGVTPETGTEL